MSQQDNVDYWNHRAKAFQNDPDKVTHQDLFQKKLELDFLDRHLAPGMNVLEVGCGNGFVTEHISRGVNKIDAFDQSEAMIGLCRERLAGRSNVNLFVHSLPDIDEKLFDIDYDVVLSVRVIINIFGNQNQKMAMQWMASKVRPGGKLILMEGSAEGLAAINAVRTRMGIDALTAPHYNTNLSRDDVLQAIPKHFTLLDDHGFWVYDLVTRILYPLMNKGETLQYNTVLHETAHFLDLIISSDGKCDLSRMLCLVFKNTAS
ncbi:MAG: Methyltransferase type 11 [Magnetococcales bacterium]|nr:Methyltransferase type 11 [Magnetococcales bacterium]